MSVIYTVIATPQATNQLLDYARYIKYTLCAPMAAAAFLDTMESKMLSLEQFPNRIPLTSEEPWHTYGVHKMVVDKYLIYFWIDEEDTKVHVVAFSRANRDQRQILEEIRLDFI